MEIEGTVTTRPTVKEFAARLQSSIEHVPVLCCASAQPYTVSLDLEVLSKPTTEKRRAENDADVSSGDKWFCCLFLLARDFLLKFQSSSTALG